MAHPAGAAFRERRTSYQARWVEHPRIVLRPSSTRPERNSFIFFFQAEDGIRDLTVTGVQTCALPIFASQTLTTKDVTEPLFVVAVLASSLGVGLVLSGAAAYMMSRRFGLLNQVPLPSQIGRASCRERV